MLLEVVLLMPLEMSNSGVALPTVGADEGALVGVSELVFHEVDLL